MNDYAFHLNAVGSNIFAFWEVLQEFLTEELCVAACKGNGWVLHSMTEGLKTASVCLAAMMDTPEVIHSVPFALQNEAFFWRL